MNKKYKYTKKHSFAEALDIRKKWGERLVKIVFNLSPFWFSIILVSLFSSAGEDCSNLLANSFLALFLTIPIYISIILLELILLGGYYLLLKIKTGSKQRCLPITKEDLEENKILCVSDYWKYMESILTVNGITFSIENVKFYSECKKVYMSYFSENKECLDFTNKMHDLVKNKPYSNFVNDFLLKYMPLFCIVDVLDEYLNEKRIP